MTGRLGQPCLVQPPLLRFLGSRICLSRRPSNGLLRVSRLFPWLDGAMWPLVLLAGFRDSLVDSRLAPFQSHGGYHFLFGIDSDGSVVRESLALWKTRAKLSDESQEGGYNGQHHFSGIEAEAGRVEGRTVEVDRCCGWERLQRGDCRGHEALQETGGRLQDKGCGVGYILGLKAAGVPETSDLYKAMPRYPRQTSTPPPAGPETTTLANNAEKADSPTETQQLANF